MIVLTDNEDKSLRAHANRLDYDMGEDAYHNAVVSLLSSNVDPVSANALLLQGTKWALSMLWKKRETDNRCIQSYINGDPTPQQVNMRAGRLPRTTCRKGLHAMTEENLYWYQGGRGCRACRRERGNRDKKALRAKS